MTNISISNTGGTLDCEAIDWNEQQKCNVAVRDVPLKTTGSIIDNDTYVLKTRRLTMSIRLTNAEKITLQGIFDESETVAIEAIASTSGYKWTYTAWLRAKPIMYEYRKESDVKEWIAELEFDVSSFSYEAI